MSSPHLPEVVPVAGTPAHKPSPWCEVNLADSSCCPHADKLRTNTVMLPSPEAVAGTGDPHFLRGEVLRLWRVTAPWSPGGLCKHTTTGITPEGMSPGWDLTLCISNLQADLQGTQR